MERSRGLRVTLPSALHRLNKGGQRVGRLGDRTQQVRVNSLEIERFVLQS